MPKHFHPGKDSYTRAFEIADEYLTHGRDKSRRPIANNTILHRIDADTIAVRLHATDVVTYHRSGLFTIYGGGWNTPTTKDRISSYSPCHPGSDGRNNWVIGWTGEITAPRVCKCRTCKARGIWMEDDWCYGPSYYENTCNGPFEVRDVALVSSVVDGVYVSNWKEHYASSRNVDCEHGRSERHSLAPCEHGEWSRHVTGQSLRTCYRCKGTGKTDYGSKRIPILSDAHTAFIVDAAGQPVGIPFTSTVIADAWSAVVAA